MDVAVIGAGIAGLSAALRLAAAGLSVTVFEKEARPGGKMRRVRVGDAEIDAGPTVFTKRAVFDELFALAGERIDDHLTIRPCETIARHVFADGASLDLFTDQGRSARAVADFAGAGAARDYRRFMESAFETLDLLDPIFMSAERPKNPLDLTMRAGLSGALKMARIGANRSYFDALTSAFSDKRLRALFARYTTYVGSSPFEAPSTLRLIAAVEAAGVWRIEGGMARLAEALADLAERKGVVLRYGAKVERIAISGGAARGLELAGGERIEAGAVLANCDTEALASGLFGAPAAAAVDPPLAVRDKSLSAIGIALKAKVSGRELIHHNVFFAADPLLEFHQIFEGRRLPSAPNVYVCAEDRGEAGEDPPSGPERLFLIVNAPAQAGASQTFDRQEIETCVTAAFSTLAASGLRLEWAPGDRHLSTPSDFAALFPGTGGALYGRASHGSTASFQRPAGRSKIRGLYLCGGSAHPGAGVPMASLSGSLAASAIVTDRASTSVSRRGAMPGGIATRSPTKAPSV